MKWGLELPFALVLAETGTEPDDLVQALIQRIGEAVLPFGLSGTALVAVLVIWWQWPKLKELPGVAQLAGVLRRGLALAVRKAPPPARGDRFSVSLAHLVDDSEHDVENVVAAGLSDFVGVEILRVDREIRDDDVGAGHERARSLLRTMQADAMIWGRILKYPGKASVPHLYWTIRHDVAAGKASGNYLPTDDLKLPELFWSDLKDVLGLLVAKSAADLTELEGRYTADRLKPFVTQVEKLLVRTDWTPENRARIEFVFAMALQSLGEQAGKSTYIVRAVNTYTNVLQEYTRERVPLDWAMTQNYLGNALARLGDWENDSARLLAAVDAYNDALKERTRECVPLDWATTQNNLGNALVSLGEQENDSARLLAAVDAYTKALEERTRERAPLKWATTQNNLGNALVRLGERENGSTRLLAAVDAYTEALQEYTREKVPLDWAMTQNNLGSALVKLGDQENESAWLLAAVAAYTDALRERTRERVPRDWATTQDNLGTALASLGERENDSARLLAAVDAYTNALQVYTREHFPARWQSIQDSLAAVRRSLERGRSEGGA